MEGDERRRAWDDVPLPLPLPLPIDPDLDAADPSEPSARHVPVAATEAPHRAEPATLAAVAVGGALGALARYLLAEWSGGVGEEFPWATFWTNVSGSFALGLVLMVLLRRFPAGRRVRALVATGFLGAFTTFSTFVVETDRLIARGRAGVAVVYVAASLALGLAAVTLGMAGGRLVPAVGSRS